MRQVDVAQLPQLRHEVVLLVVGVAEGEGEWAEVVLAHALALEVDLHAVEDEDGVVDIGREDLFEVVLDALGAFYCEFGHRVGRLSDLLVLAGNELYITVFRNTIIHM